MRCPRIRTVGVSTGTFNLRNMAGAAASTGVLALGALGAVGLINNSTDNQWLVVWDFQIVNVPNPVPTGIINVDLSICTGRNSGSFLIANNNSPVISQGPVLPGTNWTNNVPDSTLGQIFNSFALTLAGKYGFYFWNHDWPLCAIAPGDSVVAYSDANAYEDFSASFMYQVTTSSP